MLMSPFPGAGDGDNEDAGLRYVITVVVADDTVDGVHSLEFDAISADGFSGTNVVDEYGLCNIAIGAKEQSEGDTVYLTILECT